MTGRKRLKNARVLCVGAAGSARLRCCTWPRAGSGATSAFSTSTSSTILTCSGRSSMAGRTSAAPRRSPRATACGRSRPVRHRRTCIERLDSDDAIEIFAQYDLIVDGTDNFATRYLVNDACVLLGEPYVEGGSTARRPGQRVLGRPRALATAASTQSRPRHGAVLREGGTLGVLCASIGSIQWNKANKVVTDRRLTGRAADDL